MKFIKSLSKEETDRLEKKFQKQCQLIERIVFDLVSFCLVIWGALFLFFSLELFPTFLQWNYKTLQAEPGNWLLRYMPLYALLTIIGISAFSITRGLTRRYPRPVKTDEGVNVNGSSDKADHQPSNPSSSV